MLIAEAGGGTGMGLVEDRDKWNTRYAEAATPPARPEPHPLAQRFERRLPAGRLLDAACGLGRGIACAGPRIETIYAVDLSDVAIATARRLWASDPRIRWIVADVAALRFPRAFLDMVCAFGFTNWALLKDLERIVAPGGFVLYEGFAERQREVNPRLDPAWTATPASLLRLFGHWEVLACAETESDGPPYRVHLAAVHPRQVKEA
ncbi:MAG: class I SAM-dependent methyltransferase [Candidatus Lambdaproteobacteria bacterium]|nr:class I SAM-dependent methyltransferase [Candidatus Lambdaproteobacteria bacterium]